MMNRSNKERMDTNGLMLKYISIIVENILLQRVENILLQRARAR